MRPSGPEESSLGRAMRILETFDATRPSQYPGEIATRAGLPLASTYRIVNQMTALGILERTEGGVRTSVRLWELASRGSISIRLRAVALPYMTDLQRFTQQHTQLAVLQDTEVLYLERLSAPGHSVVNVTHVAGRLPALAGASGLVLVAAEAPERWNEIISQPIPHINGWEPPPPSVYPGLLARARREDFARVDGWIDPGVSAISAPIRDVTNHVVAALTVLVPNDDTAASAVPAVRMAAAGVSRALGWSQMSRS